jgi:uncharacterized membrane protein
MNEDTFERFREPVFVVAFFGGMLVFALGVAFLILGITINTAPPAPYVAENDRYLLIAVSVAATVAGLASVRFAGRVVGL